MEENREENLIRNYGFLNQLNTEIQITCRYVGTLLANIEKKYEAKGVCMPTKQESAQQSQLNIEKENDLLLVKQLLIGADIAAQHIQANLYPHTRFNLRWMLQYCGTPEENDKSVECFQALLMTIMDIKDKIRSKRLQITILQNKNVPEELNKLNAELAELLARQSKTRQEYEEIKHFIKELISADIRIPQEDPLTEAVFVCIHMNTISDIAVKLGTIFKKKRMFRSIITQAMMHSRSTSEALINRINARNQM